MAEIPHISPEDLIQLVGIDVREWEVIDPNIMDDIKQRIHNIEGIKSVSIQEHNRVVLFVGNKVIGMIGPASFENTQHRVFSRDHLYKFIDEDYRGKGLGRRLLFEYIQSGFPLPPYEYTRDIASFHLLKEFGYMPDCFICNGEEQVLFGDEDIESLLEEGGVIKLMRQD